VIDHDKGVWIASLYLSSRSTRSSGQMEPVTTLNRKHKYFKFDVKINQSPVKMLEKGEAINYILFSCVN